MPDGVNRLYGLSAFAETVSKSASVQDLLAGAADVALSVVGADAMSIGRLERAHGRVKILRNAGDLADWEEQWPTDELYPLSEYAQVATTVGGLRRWSTASVDDDETCPTDRALLQRLGKCRAASFQVQVADQIWGEVFVSRNEDRSFDDSDVAAGLVFTALLSAGLSRLELLAEMSTLAYTDPLTGVANRRAADDWLEARLGAQEPFPPVTVVLCDINGLKQVNDAYGHSAGDELIRMVSRHLVTAAASLEQHQDRRQDLAADRASARATVARIGGDEFLVLLDGVGPDSVTDVVQRLAGADLPHDSGIAVGAATTTVRAAGAESPKTAARALMRMADAAQYRHKQTRRLSADTQYGDAQPIAALLPAGQSDLTERVLAALRDDPDRSVARRLALVAEAVSTDFSAASWWISKDCDGLVTDVLGRMQRIERRGLVYLDLVSGQEFDVADYPATEVALDGGSYYASLTEGDPAERALIARMGYVSGLGAGDVDAEGTRWLVEIFGDSQTSSCLFVGRPLLRALVHLAVRAATARRLDC